MRVAISKFAVLVRQEEEPGDHEQHEQTEEENIPGALLVLLGDSTRVAIDQNLMTRLTLAVIQDPS